MEKRAAILMAEGVEECEALIVLDMLRRADIACDTVANGEILKVISSHCVPITCDCRASEVFFEDYDMIILPGGQPGTFNLRKNEELMDVIRQFDQDGKYLAAICAAPSIFADLDLVRGRQVTANPGYQQVMRDHGGEVHEDMPVVRDGNMITSQGMGTAIDFGYELIRILADEAAAQRVKREIVDLR